MLCRILKQQNGLYTVEDEDGIIRTGKAGSKVRKEGCKIIAGDFAFYTINDDGSVFIGSVKERKNSLIRPAVANIDRMFIVAAAAEPDPDLYNIDCMTALADANGITPVIIINKTDLNSSEVLSKIYHNCGYKVFTVCGSTGEGIEELHAEIIGVCVFTGQSGVGKSTIMNLLFPELTLETGELSHRISRGRNTTRTTELFKIADNAYAADTPGFGMLDFIGYDLLTKEQLNNYAFPEFGKFKENCRYRDCTHVREEGCAVISAVNSGFIPVSRHNSFVRLYEELLSKNEYR